MSAGSIVVDLTKSDVTKVLKDIMAGKTRVSIKTKKLRGRAIVKGGIGTATRTLGLLGGVLTYAMQGPSTTNVAHGIHEPRTRCTVAGSASDSSRGIGKERNC